MNLNGQEDKLSVHSFNLNKIKNIVILIGQGTLACNLR